MTADLTRPLLRSILIVGQFFLPKENRAIAAALKPGDLLTLQAEPNNPHDPLAVLVMSGPTKIGYIPKESAPAVQMFLSAPGYVVTATVTGHAANSQKNPTADVSVKRA
jgi:hypothetical protein